jgi:3-hydroxyisobutyrate dehydrogenase-like beta-hydroxyacid dehydrogenase
MPDAPITCGFIGLGSQGAPMARRMIEAGLPTVLWARRPQTLEPYRGTGARFVASIVELGREADHVGICVVNDDDVRQVCAELIPAMRPNAVIAIHSTIHPDTARQVARDAAEHGVQVIDAPVSGGSPAAEAGMLTVMLGGDADAIERARPVFETFGKLIVRLGEVGAGQHAKLINNALMAANLGVGDAALAAGDALGLARDALLELLAASSGRSFALEVRGRLPTAQAFAHAAALLTKDVRLLGEVMGPASADYQRIRDAGAAFLDAALDGRSEAAGKTGRAAS